MSLLFCPVSISISSLAKAFLTLPSSFSFLISSSFFLYSFLFNGLITFILICLLLYKFLSFFEFEKEKVPADRGSKSAGEEGGGDGRCR